RAQVPELARPAHLCEPHAEPVRQPDREGQEIVGLVAGEAEHHSLVARALGVAQVLAPGARPLLERSVHARGDLRALAVECHHDRARVAVEPGRVVVVADVDDRPARELGDVDARGGRDLASDDAQARGEQRLTGHAALRVLGQDRVEHRVGDLVGDLVGIALGDRLGGEHGSVAHRAPCERRRATLSKRASATARLDVTATCSSPPSRSRMTTSLVSWSKPAPGWDTSFTTTRSQPLRSSFLRAFATASPVSAAKPTTSSLSCRFATTSARMSSVGSNSSRGTPSARRSFLLAPTTGRKSATAAAMTATSASPAASSTAACLSHPAS